MAKITGGCQCGAVRFACESLGRASICHCRMCQKAFGGFFGPLVTVHGHSWSRGQPAYFQSSNKVRRGFCNQCGTPLTFEVGTMMDIAIGAFDEPAKIPVVLQVSEDEALPCFAQLPSLPALSAEERQRFEAHCGSIISYQHPDQDTKDWNPHHG